MSHASLEEEKMLSQSETSSIASGKKSVSSSKHSRSSKASKVSKKYGQKYVIEEEEGNEKEDEDLKQSDKGK